MRLSACAECTTTVAAKNSFAEGGYHRPNACHTAVHSAERFTHARRTHVSSCQLLNIYGHISTAATRIVATHALQVAMFPVTGGMFALGVKFSQRLTKLLT